MGYSTPGASGAEYISVCVSLYPCHNPTGMTNPDQAHEPRAPSGRRVCVKLAFLVLQLRSWVWEGPINETAFSSWTWYEGRHQASH